MGLLKDKLGWFEALLVKLFPYTDITRESECGREIYLRRWFLYPRNKDFSKNVGKPRWYLHKFYHGDEDPHCHDHPWPFTSLILKEGYWEETPVTQQTDEENLASLQYYERDGEMFRKIWYPAGSILKRPARWQHRVILEDSNKPAWTIVKTGVKERSWGFWIKDKLCPWRNYESGVCWCDEN